MIRRAASRESGWVAGDVGDDVRVDLENCIEGVLVETGAGRVEDDVNGVCHAKSVTHKCRENFFGGAFVEFDVVEFVEVDGEVFAGRGRRFDADDFGVFVGKEFAEQANAAVEIEKGGRLVIGNW